MTMTESRIDPEFRQAIRTAARLVDDLDAQRHREERAYRTGYEDGYASGYEVGYGTSEHEMDQAWSEVARKVRALGSPTSRTFAEKRAEELEGCKPRAADFPGLLRDRRVSL